MPRLVRPSSFETNSSSCHSLTISTEYDLLQIKANKLNCKKILIGYSTNLELPITLQYYYDGDRISNPIDKLTYIISDQLTGYHEYSISSRTEEGRKALESLSKVKKLLKNDALTEEVNQAFEPYFNFIMLDPEIVNIKSWLNEEFGIKLKIRIPCSQYGLDLWGVDHESTYTSSKICKDKDTFIKFLSDPNSFIDCKSN